MYSNAFYRMGYPVEQQKYQALGAVHINMNYTNLEPNNEGLDFENSSEQNPPISEYYRWLDLDSGVAHVTYKMCHSQIRATREVGGESSPSVVTFKREVFASYGDNVIAIRFTADRTRSISFRASLRGKRNMAHSNYGTNYFRMDSAPVSDFDKMRNIDVFTAQESRVATPHGISTATVVLSGKGDDYLGIKVL